MNRSVALALLALAACKTPEPERNAPTTSTAAASSSASATASAARPAAPTADPDAPAPDPGPTFDALKQGLAKVKAAGDDAFTMEAIPPVAPLVGQSRDAIETALGKPTECKKDTGAPCKSTDEVFYSLYKLAKGARGGGPELVITYDEDAFCSKAEIQGTK